ncbi:MAG TPA: CotH kinase family protein [bacterium]
MTRIKVVISFLLLFSLSTIINAQIHNNIRKLKSKPDKNQIRDDHSYKNSDTENFTSSNLPIIVIATQGQEIPDEPKIIADMKIIYNEAGVRNYLTNPPNHYYGKIGIEIRGSTTKWFPKKQYAVETRDVQGNDSTVSLLGLPAEEDWVLDAPYSDKSLVRNAIIFYLANQMGRYASRTRFCELVLNGDYQGVYVLMEKVKRDKNRVDISKLTPTDISGDALTGGYMIKIDKPDGAKIDGWESLFLPVPGAWQRIYYQYHYPDQDEITAEQKAYIQTFLLSYETVMSGPSYRDPQIGYAKYIDVASAVDYFILNEVAKNVDAYRLSAFMYKDRDSKNRKLILGPIWDYNLTFGNADYYGAQYVSGWQVYFYQKEDTWLVPFWWGRLMADSNFVNQINSRWHELRKNIITIPRICAFIDSLTTYLDEAQKRNFQRWPILGVYVWPNPFIGGSYAAEIRYLKQWIQDRILWMDAKIPGTSTTVADHQATSSSEIYALKQNYPNPFNSCKNIEYVLPGDFHVTLKIFNLQSHEIRTLIDEFQTAGAKLKSWDGTDHHGQRVSSGIYFYHLKVGEQILSRKMLLLN